MERSIPPPTTTKNWAAEAILTKVAPLSVSSSTGPERNVADIENPMVTSTASRAQARAVRGWRRAHSPPHGGAGTVSRPGWALIVGSWLGGCLDRRLVAVRADLALAAEHRQSQDALLAELVRLEHTRDLPGAHDDYPVAHGDHFGQL